MRSLRTLGARARAVAGLEGGVKGQIDPCSDTSLSVPGATPASFASDRAMAAQVRGILPTMKLRQNNQ